jgi:erythromycin esterase
MRRFARKPDSGTSPTRVIPPDVVEWLRRSAIALDDDDLVRGLIAAETRVIGLGEATHGTRELTEHRLALLRSIVAGGRPVVLALEADWFSCFALDAYVTLGAGSGRDALLGVRSWPSRTYEMLEVVEWIRAWNHDRASNSKVRVFGVDMQAPSGAAGLLENYLATMDPGFSGRAREILSAYDAPFVPAQHEQLARMAGDPLLFQRQLDEVAARMQRLQKERTTDGGPDSWCLARQHLRVLSQASAWALGVRSSAVRDRAMAENVLWLTEQFPDACVVCFAHNFHLERRQQAVAKWQPMGEYLAAKLAERYVAIGLFAGDGSFLAEDAERRGHFREFELTLPDDATLEVALGVVGRSPYLVDLRTLSDGPVARWFEQPQPGWGIGAIYPSADAPMGLGPLATRGFFDALLFVGRSTPIRRL